MPFDYTRFSHLIAPHLVSHHEVDQLRTQALPLYRHGRVTWPALIAACRILYVGYDHYRPNTKANLLLEARGLLDALTASE